MSVNFLISSWDKDSKSKLFDTYLITAEQPRFRTRTTYATSIARLQQENKTCSLVVLKFGGAFNKGLQ